MPERHSTVTPLLAADVFRLWFQRHSRSTMPNASVHPPDAWLTSGPQLTFNPSTYFSTTLTVTRPLLGAEMSVKRQSRDMVMSVPAG
jgi:hypothetical protein